MPQRYKVDWGLQVAWVPRGCTPVLCLHLYLTGTPGYLCILIRTSGGLSQSSGESLWWKAGWAALHSTRAATGKALVKAWQEKIGVRAEKKSTWSGSSDCSGRLMCLVSRCNVMCIISERNEASWGHHSNKKTLIVTQATHILFRLKLQPQNVVTCW